MRSSSPSLRVRTAPHSPTPGTTQGISGTPPSSLIGQPSVPHASSAAVCKESGDGQGTVSSCSSSVTSVTPTSTPTPPPAQSSRAGNTSEKYLSFIKQ